MKKNEAVALIVLLVLAQGLYFGALTLGVPKLVLEITLVSLWVACGAFLYYYVAVRNADRFRLYTKLVSRGGKGPGLFEKTILVVFAPYFCWTYGVWPKLTRRFK